MQQKKRRIEEKVLMPMSGVSSQPGIVSFKPKIARSKEQNSADALKIVGSAKGYACIHATPSGSWERFIHPSGPKIDGRLTIGSAKQPPSARPITTPELKTSGNNKKAREWYFFSLTISAVIVLITPILPFPKPAMIRQNITAGTVVEKPNPILAIMDIKRPATIVGFLPYVLAICAHGREVAN